MHPRMDLNSAMWQQSAADASLPKHPSPEPHRVDQQEHQKAKEYRYTSTQPLSTKRAAVDTNDSGSRKKAAQDGTGHIKTPFKTYAKEVQRSPMPAFDLVTSLPRQELPVLLSSPNLPIPKPQMQHQPKTHRKRIPDQSRTSVPTARLGLTGTSIIGLGLAAYGSDEDEDVTNGPNQVVQPFKEIEMAPRKDIGNNDQLSGAQLKIKRLPISGFGLKTYPSGEDLVVQRSKDGMTVSRNNVGPNDHISGTESDLSRTISDSDDVDVKQLLMATHGSKTCITTTEMSKLSPETATYSEMAQPCKAIFGTIDPYKVSSPERESIITSGSKTLVTAPETNKPSPRTATFSDMALASQAYLEFTNVYKVPSPDRESSDSPSITPSDSISNIAPPVEKTTKSETARKYSGNDFVRLMTTTAIPDDWKILPPDVSHRGNPLTASTRHIAGVVFHESLGGHWAAFTIDTMQHLWSGQYFDTTAHDRDHRFQATKLKYEGLLMKWVSEISRTPCTVDWEVLMYEQMDAVSCGPLSWSWINSSIKNEAFNDDRCFKSRLRLDIEEPLAPAENLIGKDGLRKRGKPTEQNYPKIGLQKPLRRSGRQKPQARASEFVSTVDAVLLSDDDVPVDDESSADDYLDDHLSEAEYPGGDPSEDDQWICGMQKRPAKEPKHVGTVRAAPLSDNELILDANRSADIFSNLSDSSDASDLDGCYGREVVVKRGVVKDYIDPDHIAHEILDRRFRAFSLLSKQEIKGLLKRHTEHRATKYGKGMAGDLRRLALRLEVPIPAGIDPGIIDEMRWPNATQQSLVGFGRKVILGEIQRLGLRGGWLLQKAEPQEGDDTVLESAAKSLLQYPDSDPKERASIERWSFDWKTHSRRAVNYVESATSKASLQSEATKRFLTLSTTINGATRDFNRAELRDLIAEHDSREEVRKCLLEDKLLPPIEIIPEDSKLVILSYRFSSTRDIKKRSGKVSNFFEKVESSLEEGGILPGLGRLRSFIQYDYSIGLRGLVGSRTASPPALYQIG